jgi:hypothetical protein
MLQDSVHKTKAHRQGCRNSVTEDARRRNGFVRFTAVLNIKETVPLLPRGLPEAISLAERVRDFRTSGRDAAMRTG